MDVARNAVRSAATGSYNPEGGGGAGVTAMMKLAPEVDVQAIKVLHAVSWLRVALAAALEGLHQSVAPGRLPCFPFPPDISLATSHACAAQSMAANLTSKAKEMSTEAVTAWQSSSWDPLGPPVVGASGPVVRAVGNVYHSSLAFRKELQAEANGMVKTFEKRLATFEAQGEKAKDSLASADTHHTVCQEKTSNVKALNDSLQATSKAVQTLLEAQSKIEGEREAAAQAREADAEKEKENFVAGINKRREEIEENFKEAEQKLVLQYKKDETQGFV